MFYAALKWRDDDSNKILALYCKREKFEGMECKTKYKQQAEQFKHKNFSAKTNGGNITKFKTENGFTYKVGKETNFKIYKNKCCVTTTSVPS